MKRRNFWMGLGVCAFVGVTASMAILPIYRAQAQAPAGKAPAPAQTDEAAVARTKREMRLLDDIYKTSIVLITTHYVDDKDSLPAGAAFKALFDSMRTKGWHQVRLIDGTGDPYNPDNTPREGFEQRAMKKLLDGASVVEEVTTEGKEQYLLAATAIPVVMDKCVLCHESYRDVAKGKAIGALSYKLPLVK